MADKSSVCHGVRALLVEKFSGDEVSVRAESGTVVVSFGGTSHELNRGEAVSLRRALGETLTERRAFVHTVGTHRSDGSYVVARRGADSAGHRKVFERFEELRGLYESLPGEFSAGDVELPGLTGSRRHLVVAISPNIPPSTARSSPASRSPSQRITRDSRR